ncbi:MAG TPA: GGDEF domain-containing protein [Chromatiales bacterium]|nr:GGDEF domain-containing protein [Chromatiales bacterium]
MRKPGRQLSAAAESHSGTRSTFALPPWIRLDPDPEIRRAQYDHLRNNCIAAPLTSLVVALTLCAILGLLIDPTPALTWAGVLAVALTARASICFWRPRTEPGRDRWCLVSLHLALLTGLIWGLAPLTVPLDDFGALGVVLLTMGGVAVGMLPILGFVHGAFTTYGLIVILPSLVILLGVGLQGKPAHLGLGLFLIAFTLNLVRTGDVVTQTFLSNLRSRIAQTIAAEHDPLTGLPNRRKFDREFAAAWTLAVRARTPISVLILDLDHFKEYNDRYGHPAGDRSLRAVAEALSRQLPRASDHVARVGGEEFVILLPTTDAEGGQVLAERLRRTIEALHIPHAASPVSPWLTVSIGGATLCPTLATSPNALLDMADRALYTAKRCGRNRVAWFPMEAVATSGEARVCQSR